MEYLLICVCLHGFYFFNKKNVEWIWKEDENKKKRILPEGIFHLVMTQNRRNNRSHIKIIFFFLPILFLSNKKKFSSHFPFSFWKFIGKSSIKNLAILNWTLISSNMLPLCLNLLSFISIIHHALKRISKKKFFFGESEWERKKKWKIFPFTVNRQPIVHYICVHFHRYLFFTHSTALLIHIYFILFFFHLMFHQFSFSHTAGTHLTSSLSIKL